MLFIILHNVRSAQNVGAIFRTADAAGVSKIYLTGYTPLPTDRFGRTNEKIAKTALGAEKTIPWEHVKSSSVLIARLKKEKVQVVACEQSPKAISYTKWKPKFPLAILFGNEVTGISPTLLKRCGSVVEISMHGKKESLNVSVAAGIILFTARQFL